MKTKIFVTAASTLVVLAACSNDAEKHSAKTEPAKVVMQDKAGDDKAAAGDTEVNPRLLRRFQPLPEGGFAPVGDASHDAEKVALGRALFFDARLSKDSDVSCNSCHDLGK